MDPNGDFWGLTFSRIHSRRCICVLGDAWTEKRARSQHQTCNRSCGLRRQEDPQTPPEFPSHGRNGGPTPLHCPVPARTAGPASGPRRTVPAQLGPRRPPPAPVRHVRGRAGAPGAGPGGAGAPGRAGVLLVTTVNNEGGCGGAADSAAPGGGGAGTAPVGPRGRRSGMGTRRGE